MSLSHISLSRAGVALAATVAALALPAASATASTATTDTTPTTTVAAESHLSLTIVPDSPTPGNPPTTVTLECGPAGGDHPDPVLACEELTAVDGDFESLDRPAFCSSEWDPVTITAAGTWLGREVSFTDTYTNRMCAANATGGVFGF